MKIAGKTMKKSDVRGAVIPNDEDAADSESPNLSVMHSILIFTGRFAA